jgi:peptidyl-prolyl cis-trans isomerase SurA
MEFLPYRSLSTRTSALVVRFVPASRTAFGALLLATSLAAITGCQRGHSSDTLATVNGKAITKAEVDTLYENTVGNQPQKPSAVQAEIVHLNILRQLIDEEILMQRAAKVNLVASNEDVDARINEIKAPFTQEEFQKRLADKHLTLDDLKREIRHNLTEEKLFNKEINSKIDITDSDIAKYYNDHKSEFNLPQPQYHLAQIVVTNIPAQPQQAGNLQNSKAMNDAEAKKKIEMLHNRLDSGEDFGALASNFSESPETASNGGDMGFISEQNLHSDPEVFNAVSKLTPGEITDVLPVYSGPDSKKVVGYAIYKLLDKEAAGQRELSDPRVQQAIRQQLRDSRAQLLKDAYLEMLRDQARVNNYYAEDIFKNGAR